MNDKLLKSIVVFLVTILIFLVGGEIYYRFINTDYIGTVYSKSYQANFAPYIRINQWGFRDKQRSLKRPSPTTHRIIWFGPSDTYGKGVKNVNERVTEQLEMMLDQHIKDNGPIGSITDFEVLNFSMPGPENYCQAKKILEGVKKAGLEFDTVMFYWSNEVVNNLQNVQDARAKLNTKKAKTLPEQPAIVQWAVKNLYMADWIYYVSKMKSFSLIDGLTNNQWTLVQLSKDENLKPVLDELKSIQELSGTNSFYILLRPLGAEPQDRKDYAYVTEKVKNYANRYGLGVIDLTDSLGETEAKDVVVSKYDGHFKPKFHAVMAKKIYQHIVGNGIEAK